MPEELSARHLLRRLLGLVALLAAVAVAISSLPGLGTVRTRFAHGQPVLLLAVALLKLGSSLSNVVGFRDVFCRGMSWRFSYELAMAEQATNVLLPTGGAGGLALGAWALRQGGMPTDQIARRSVTFFVLTSIPNFVCVALLGPVLLSGVAGHVPTAPTAVFSGLAWALAVGVAALPWLLRRGHGGQQPARTVRRRVRAGAETLAGGIADTGGLVRARRWPAIAGACGYLAFDIAAMIVAFGAFGGVPAVVPLVFAYTIGQLGGLIPLPGGIGGTDGGLIGATVLYGSSLPRATAAVLAYRAFQLSVPAILGTIAFIQLRAHLNRSSAPASTCAALAEPYPEAAEPAAA